MSEDDRPMISYWKGRPIMEMTKEELIEALEEMGRLYNEELKRHSRSMCFLPSALCHYKHRPKES